MFRRFSVTFSLFSMVLDGLLAGLALRIAAATRPLFNGLPGVETVPFPPTLPEEVFYLFPVLWVGIMLLSSVYDGRRNLRVVDEFSSLTASSLLAGVTISGVLFLTYRDMSRVLFFAFFLATILLLVGWRSIARIVFREQLRRNYTIRKVLILGAGEGGNRLKHIMSEQPGLGLRLVGLLDDDPLMAQSDPCVLGDLSQLRRVIQSDQVDDVVVALPRSAHERLNWAVSELHDLPVQVWVIPDYFSLTLHRASVEELAGVPMLNLRAPALSDYQRMVKRGFDVIVTLVSMPVILPLMGLIALWIRLTSPGPMLYRARRAGENGRVFNMLKFRTMVQNADQLLPQVAQHDGQGNLILKVKDDPRITPVGRFLRKTSLDEIPQLFNVLVGDMSLVGPRPEMPFLVEQYQPWQRKRFAVPQGMTGWWQIHGRSDKPMHLHTEEDLYYVQHYSIWLDLQIILQTIWVVLRGKGAY
jgi:exopolysaccharide biosynthesis polyprenyl glycosylphosphotransferase